MRFRDWFRRHFGPGPSYQDLEDRFHELTNETAIAIESLEREWNDMQDYLNRWAAKNAKRKSRDTKAALEAASEPDVVDPDPLEVADGEIATVTGKTHKEELRSRAFALRRRA